MSDLYEISCEFVRAGMRLFPLHRFRQGKCECGHSNCTAVGKHPARVDWVKSPIIDEAVLDTWLDGDLMPPYMGLGWALDAGHIVIDVDPRNGGNESFAALQADIGIDLIDACSAVVRTGGGGWHLYFAKPDADLAWKMPDKYHGIDIKQGGGFVVIPGSEHASGSDYQWHSFAKSSIDQLVTLPESLAKLLARAKVQRQEGDYSDVGADEIRHMLEYLNPDMAHSDWIKVGMAIHRGTNGGGFDLWDEWSVRGEKYKASEMAHRWKSFDRHVASSVTIASLISMATDAGWVQVDHFDFEMTEAEIAFMNSFDQWGKKKESTKVEKPKVTDFEFVDLHQPPGMMNALYRHILNCSRYENRNMALAATLTVASNIIGRGMYLSHNPGITANLILLVVAASSTGKDSMITGSREILTYAGIGKACYGRIKSDKDLMDAFADHQYANYLIDEFGIFLERVSNSKKSGAHYLEGVVGTIMDVFTKCNAVFATDRSRREDITAHLANEITKAEKNCEQHGGSKNPKGEIYAEKAAYLKKVMGEFLDNGGLKNPWLSMFTTATPSTMKDAFTQSSVESGFLSRALVFFEHEENPRAKPDFIRAPALPMPLEMRLLAKKFCMPEMTAGRIDDYGDRTAIGIDDDAADYLKRLDSYLYEWSEALKAKGMTPLGRRANEMINKICLIIAGWNDTPVTMEIARYAAKLVWTDLETKIRKVEISSKSDSADTEDRKRAVILKILDVCQVPAAEGQIVNRCKSPRNQKDSILSALKYMVNQGLITAEEYKPPRGAATTKYTCTDAGREYMAKDD